MKQTSEQKSAARRKATELVMRTPRKDIAGQKFGRLTVEEYVGSKNHSTHWRCRCDCGEILEQVRYSHLSNSQVVSCGCARRSGNDHPKWSGYQEMTGTFLSNIKNNARRRGLPYKISNKYIWSLFVNQKRRCALSGKSISFFEGTASLDRIDSGRGYLKDNIQWTHKHINIAKMDHSSSYFIEMCREVAQWCDISYV